MSEEMTTADSQFVAAFCSTCGGFTMFHAEPTSATASKWARQCKAKGDRIEYRTDTNLGPSCKCERPRPKKRNAKAAQP